MKSLTKCYRMTMGSFGMRKYLNGGIVTFVFGIFLVTQLAVTIFEHVRLSGSWNFGVREALGRDILEMTFSIQELYNIKHGMIEENVVQCRSDVKYAVILLTEIDSFEYRDNMRRMWRNFELIIDADTKNSSKVELTEHQIFFLVNSIEYSSNDDLRNIINESSFHKDVFYIENSLAAQVGNDSYYNFSPTVRGLLFASSVCGNVSHMIVGTDTAFLNVRNAISMLDHKALPWSVYGWFYSNMYGGDLDRLTHMDCQSFIISSDLTSAFLDASKTELENAHDAKVFYEQLLQLKARIIPDNNFLVGKPMMREPQSSECDYVPQNIISRASIQIEDMRRLWFILREPFPHCNGALSRESFWNYFKVRHKEVWTYNKTILVENTDLCSSDPELIIMVHSHVRDFKNRSITRDTWASPGHNVSWPVGNYSLRTKVVFVLASINDTKTQSKIHEEAKNHRDILQGSFEEKYTHLSMKHTFGFSWIAKHCDSVKYVLKADDDVIVNLPYLQTVLEASPLRRSIVGSVRACPWRSPVRNGQDKWGVSKNIYKLDHYPVYVPGSSYVVTIDIVAELASVAQRLSFLPFDDVFYTGILGRVIGVNHVYWPQYRNKFAAEPKEQPSESIACNILANHWVDTFFSNTNRASTVWKHLESHGDLKCLWPDDLQNNGNSFRAQLTFFNFAVKFFFMVVVVSLIVCCKTGLCS